MAYMSTGSDQFGTIDLNTGVFTQLGNSGQLLSGLGTIGGNIYGGLLDSNILYQVNLANGGLTEIGTGSIEYNDTGSTTTGLYAVNVGVTDLYQVNPLTGATTLIGPTGFTSGFGIIGMSTGSSTLYFAGGYNLYSLSTTTGEATLIGSQGFAVGALVSEGGALWAGASPLDVYTLNTSTAAGTLVTGVTGGAVSFWGLTPDPLTTTSVPEPSSVILLATVLPALAFVARKRIAQGL
jgi:hypothetical protein